MACTCDFNRPLEDRGFTKIVRVEDTPYTTHAAIAALIGEGNFVCCSRTSSEPGEGLRDVYTTAEIAQRLHREHGMQVLDFPRLS